MSRRTAQRLVELEALLADLRLASESRQTTELLRDLLGVPLLASLRFVVAPGRARIDVATSAGDLVPPSYFRELRTGINGGEMSFLFSLRSPEREQRNKALVFPGVVGLRRSRPSDLRRYGKRRLGEGTQRLIDHIERYGIAEHFQLRTVLCEGPLALGYINAFSERPFTARQRRIFGAAMRLWHARIVLDHRLAEADLAASALDAALEVLGRPAYVVDRRGTVRHANGLGVSVLDRDGAIREQIRDVFACHSSRFHAYVVDREHMLIVARETPLADIAHATATEFGLGARATQVLVLSAGGLTTKTIAARLGVATNTVEYHLTNIFSKLGVSTRSELLLALHERAGRRLLSD